MISLSERQSDILFAVPAGIVASICCQAAFIVYENFNIPIRDILSNINIWVFLLLSLFFTCLFAFRRKLIHVGELLYKYRYVFGAVAILLCVLFKLSGSSVHIWESILPQAGNDDGLLLGTARAIRSDEWAVNTPFALSQCFNKTELFPYFGDVLRGAKTDMFIVYGQPVLSWEVLFRPFHWGYLFFGAERGLAFFWSARLVALLLCSFELGMLLLNQKKDMSFILALLITFSSTVQWWFAVNGLVEMLVFGELAILMIASYMKTSSYSKRILIAGVLIVCAGGYLLTFYPAWQVPLAYLFLVIFIWTLCSNLKKSEFCAKKDITILLSAMILFVGCMALIFLKSADTVLTVLNTDYPGQRSELGGGNLHGMFYYLIDYFTPAKDVFSTGYSSNQCEIAGFFSLFPLGIITSFIVIFKEKNRDLLLILLLGAILLFGAYTAFPLPEFIAKLTLLDKSAPGRVAQTAFSLANMMLLFRSISLLKTKMKAVVTICFALAFSACVCMVAKKTMYPMFDNPLYFYSSLLITAVGVFLFVSEPKQNSNQHLALISYCCAVAVFCGVIVNPVQKGMDEVLNNPLIKEIKQIVSNEDKYEKWMVDTDSFPIINIPITAGAPTINCTNTYPNLDLMARLDSHNKYKSAYNGYSHMFISLTDDEETTFERFADQCKIKLSKNDLDILHPEYILSTRDLECFSTGEQSITMYSQIAPYKIFRVDYSEDYET